nr:hypothetical protein [Tanacetum cinerariifolium]
MVAFGGDSAAGDESGGGTVERWLTARLLRERLAGCKQPLRCVWFDRFAPRQWWWRRRCGGVTVGCGYDAMAVVCGVVGSGGGDSGDGSGVTWWWWRVKESGVGDRVIREVGNLFGFARKSPPEKSSAAA